MEPRATQLSTATILTESCSSSDSFVNKGIISSCNAFPSTARANDPNAEQAAFLTIGISSRQSWLNIL